MRKTGGLKKGDVVVFDPSSYPTGHAVQGGEIALVEGYQVQILGAKRLRYLTVKWLTKTSQMDGGYEIKDFKLATPERIALQKLRA